MNEVKRETILLIEDNEDDVFLMRRALQKAGIANPLQVTRDGQEAMDYLAGRGRFADRLVFPSPAFVFIDLKLPYVSGLQLLEWIRVELEPEPEHVFILTSSKETSDVRKAQELRVDAYLVKPPTAPQLLELEEIHQFHWVLKVTT